MSWLGALWRMRWSDPLRAFYRWQFNREVDAEIKRYKVAGSEEEREVQKLAGERCIQSDVWNYSITDWERSIGQIVEVRDNYSSDSTTPYLVTRVERYRGTYGSSPATLARVYGRKVKK